MEDSVKKRILGAFVTIMAIVLVLPNLLDGDHRKNRLLSEIPQEPPVPEWVDEKEVKKVKIALQDLKAGDLQAKVEPPEPKSLLQDEAKEQGLGVDRSGLDGQGKSVTWVLKVGAFKQHNNAYKLRDQLRKAGLKSYTLKGSSADLERVYVGPVLQRAEAERIKILLNSEHKIKDAVIQRYQPE